MNILSRSHIIGLPHAKTYLWAYAGSKGPDQPAHLIRAFPVSKQNQRIVENVRMESKGLGPVVQSVVSLTSSLRVISLTVLADSIYNILIFFAEKM